ncbi:beta-propeller fold lactonase family protein [Streptomyces sp. NPDC007369]|uniref:lactonase family protein n=1 Tax=Streptomyces sp. NPDC007369 TaxID=3154589 RepID=UPI00340A9D99
MSSPPLAADGGPVHPPSVPPHQGSGPDADRQSGPHAPRVLPDPSGCRVLSVDLGTDAVRVCSLDPVTGALRVHTETALRAGSGPRHLVLRPRGGVAVRRTRADAPADRLPGGSGGRAADARGRGAVGLAARIRRTRVPLGGGGSR